MALVGLNGSELKVLLALPHANTKELDDVLEILHRCSCVVANVSTVISNETKNKSLCEGCLAFIFSDIVTCLSTESCFLQRLQHLLPWVALDCVSRQLPRTAQFE